MMGRGMVIQIVRIYVYFKPKLFYSIFHNGMAIPHTKHILSVNYQLMTNIRGKKDKNTQGIKCHEQSIF